MRGINNNVLAVIIIVLTILVGYMNYQVITTGPTGFSIKSADVSLCLNTPPIPTFENCLNATELVPYTCIVNTTDHHEAQNRIFTDNSTLFTITPDGIISFTPDFMSRGNYSINITVDDQSSCDNQIASAILNLTILPNPENATLSVNDSTKTQITYQMQPITFLANYSTLQGVAIPTANCTLRLNTTGTYGDPLQMVYNATLQTYTRIAQSLQGNHPYRVRCDGDTLYGVSIAQDNFTVTNRPPYPIADYPNITMQQGTTYVGENLNDYFDDLDLLDILTFSQSTLPLISFSYSPAGRVTIAPNVVFTGTAEFYFFANDGFDSAQSNLVRITVIPIDFSPAPSGGGGGGGGGGGPQPPPCRPEWECSEWDACMPTGFQTRTCVDLNDCGRDVLKPSEMQDCVYVGTCFDNIKNCHSGMCELGVDCGGPCEPCETCYDGIQNQGEEGIDCGGPCPTACLEEEKDPEEEIPGIIPEVPDIVRRTGIALGIIIAVSAVLLSAGSYVFHENLAVKLLAMFRPLPPPTGKNKHITHDARFIIALEIILRDVDQHTYKDNVSVIIERFRKLMKHHYALSQEPTYDLLKDAVHDEKNTRLARDVLLYSSALENAAYDDDPKEYPLREIVDFGVRIARRLTYTDRYQHDLSDTLSLPEMVKERLLEDALHATQTLVDHSRTYSAILLLNEASRYYQAVRRKKHYATRIEKLAEVLQDRMTREGIIFEDVNT